MTDDELNTKLYEAGAAPEGVLVCVCHRIPIMLKVMSHEPCVPWTPATNTYQAFEMAERFPYGFGVFKDGDIYRAQVNFEHHAEAKTPARALSEASLEALETEDD